MNRRRNYFEYVVFIFILFVLMDVSIQCGELSCTQIDPVERISIQNISIVSQLDPVLSYSAYSVLDIICFIYDFLVNTELDVL